VPHAKVLIFDTADLTTPIGSGEGLIQYPWQPVDVPSQTDGRFLQAFQIALDGTKSGGSNVVEVISHTVVYPNGLPQPVLQVPPPLECGAAIGVEPAIPSATIRIFSEEPDNGGFKPRVEIGTLRDFPDALVNKFKLKHRISAQAEICTDKSPISPFLTVVAGHALQAPTIRPFTQDADRVGIASPAVPPPAQPDPPTQGTTLEIIDGTRPPGSQHVGGQPTPGTGYQQVLISPNASTSGKYRASQALCTPSALSEPVSASRR
jgi:hypothetical protein